MARRHMTESQRAMVAARLATYVGVNGPLEESGDFANGG